MTSPIIKEERIGDCRLILGDCMEVMPLLGKVDAVLTDPPYGIKQDKGFSGAGGFSKPVARREYKGGWDNNRPSTEVIYAVIEKAPVHVIWGGQFLADLLPAQGRWLFWDKCMTMPSYGDGELAWTSLDGVSVKQFTYNGNGMQAKEKGRLHPTQKPVALMQWCLGFLPDAKTILDPFMGSGTTGVACVNLGRSFIGIERDPEYFDICIERISKAHQQGDLFVDKPAIAKDRIEKTSDLFT